MHEAKQAADQTDGLAIQMRLWAETLRQANKSQDELAIADLLEQGAERIELLEARLQDAGRRWPTVALSFSVTLGVDVARVKQAGFPCLSAPPPDRNGPK